MFAQVLDSGSLRSHLLCCHTATVHYGAQRSKRENRADLAVGTVWSLNPDCKNSLFWFLFSTLCLSFLHASVSVFFLFFIIPASFLSLALLSNHSLALSVASYPAFRLSPSLCKTFILIANSSVHPQLSCFMPLHFVSVLLPFSPSFCLYFLYRVTVPCDCLPSLTAELLLDGLPLPPFLSH